MAADPIDRLQAVMDKASAENNKIATMTVEFQAKMNIANGIKQAGNASAIH